MSASQKTRAVNIFCFAEGARGRERVCVCVWEYVESERREEKMVDNGVEKCLCFEVKWDWLRVMGWVDSCEIGKLVREDIGLTNFIDDLMRIVDMS